MKYCYHGNTVNQQSINQLIFLANVEMADAYVAKTQEDMDNWQQEVLKRLDQEQDFIAQLRKRRQHSNSSSINQSDTENDK
jgi:hypothetical protein